MAKYYHFELSDVLTKKRNGSPKTAFKLNALLWGAIQKTKTNQKYESSIKTLKISRRSKDLLAAHWTHGNELATLVYDIESDVCSNGLYFFRQYRKSIKKKKTHH